MVRQTTDQFQVNAETAKKITKILTFIINLLEIYIKVCYDI